MNSQFYQLDFYGLKRNLLVSYLSPKLKIANFNILGDVELTEKAGEKMQLELQKRNILPDCFVGPEVKVVPLIHHMAKRFGHNRYVVLRKSVKGYMSSPHIEYPWETTPKHVKKLVIGLSDREYLANKKVVLIDDVVSTGATMDLLTKAMQKIHAIVVARCSIFKQGERYNEDLIHLAKLPLMTN